MKRLKRLQLQQQQLLLPRHQTQQRIKIEAMKEDRFMT
jgi:hypothetical protein